MPRPASDTDGKGLTGDGHLSSGSLTGALLTLAGVAGSFVPLGLGAMFRENVIPVS
ncbi:hypothetical protein AOE01nite_29910 [Acetobacter oeni]|uniref:Uncharacterized protein n=1 Tax=Acetobacter oeni TaxID=304077 RepID=A0A511XP98_9PROT|nr:hypothetical protein [Acetobacter oeni]NHO18926.1 hypothetical protein [Acetobacter oeni]GEN64767.1 hypothetical protein AOE01nite_29910 [Acetobacter oeni]